MATQVSISGSNRWAKIRSPVGVWLLSVVTLGIYGWFWWYYINRELRDLGLTRGAAGLGDNPGLSTLAYALGWLALYIPFVWTIVGTTKRIQTAQRLVGVTDVMSGWLAGLLWVFTLGIGGVIYTQSSLNKIWHTQPAATPALAAPTPTADADLDFLKKLSELRDSGAISAEEFETAKASVLPQQQPATPQPEPPASVPFDAPPPSQSQRLDAPPPPQQS